ncbi:MAG: DNA polymerase III subunit alpha [Desulfobacterales bacterium]|nr:DNA polymerase III subunit alpha [Desulfobacterales bacterium]
MNFVHLNVHSHYSKGWGVGTIEELCQAARDRGINKLALTDTNGLYGLVFFVQTAREMGITPIVGSEILANGHRGLLLVKNRRGYANLSRIISARHCHQGFDLIRTLRENREGLIVFSDDFKLLKALKQDSIEDLFVEMSPGFQMANCYAFSRKSNIPPVATNRVYLIRKDQFRLHLILRAVSLNSKISRLTRDDACLEHNFLNSSRDMTDQFPHAPVAISNTRKIAESCLSDWDLNRIIFPCFENMDDREAFDRLYQATLKGCRQRYGKITRAVKERVEHEMRIIREKNFAHYFLVVADITKRARRSCGRGSAAASIVAYALEITHVDPIKHNLFFERFLNPGRMDPPDIDVDFAWDERDQVIDYVFARYGNRRAAMVANHNTFAARAAIREVAKVFGLTDREIGRVTDKIGFKWRLRKTWRELSRHPKLRGIEFEKPWNEILSAAARLEAHFNHLSTHCGGLVVVPDEIRRYCPVEISASGVQVLQWEKDSVENAGLVKIDILGNRSLAVIRDALDLVEKNYGRRIHYASLNPINDPRTVRIFYQGDTFGVFYFESPATRQVLTKIKSLFTFEEYLQMDHFHLNVVVTSIIRPASNRSIHTWLSRLKGEPWDPPHPFLRPMLEETLGVMVFQEQLSQAAIHLAGFDAGEAETLRKVVTKKLKEKKLRDFYARFVKGASEKGVGRKAIEEVWQMMMGFDGYSFCKPHSASYTMVAYKSAFLRAHYPAEFMASVISNGGGYYSAFGYLSEARRMGLKILPPDINRSEIKYTGKDREVRVGLMQLKDLSQDSKDTIIHERSKNGPFISLEDFLDRTGSHIHLQDVRLLIKAGCFDSIVRGTTRPDLMWHALRFFDQKKENKTPTLFSEPHKIPPNPPLKKGGVIESPPLLKGDPGGFFKPPLNSTLLSVGDRRNRKSVPYSKALMLKHEEETLGFLFSIHPLDRYKEILEDLDYICARDLHTWVGKQVTTIGWQITGKTVRTKDGQTMKFISFEDQTGIYETVLFPKIYHRYCHMLNATRPYILKGKVEENFGAITMTVHWIGFLGSYRDGLIGD